MGGAAEVLRHFRVHGDHEFTLLRHQSIAFLDLLAYPVLKRRADHGSYDVHDPLLGRLGQVNLVRQVVCHDWVVVDELHDLLQRQVLVLRHAEVHNAVVLQVALLLVHNVLEEVDGDVV